MPESLSSLSGLHSPTLSDIVLRVKRAFKARNFARWFFLFGFEKNERANVTGKELEALQKVATDLLALSAKELDAHVESGAIQEISNDDQA